MVFKVDFTKAYDSIRWDYLEDVLLSFGFGVKWCKWIRGSLMSSMASILVNGSPTSEFQFHCGLKQGDPLASYLFILVMESLHLSFTRILDASIFSGVRLDSSTVISHLFYADDAIFIGDWSQNNLKGILYSLYCFSLLSGLSINVKKSQLLGVGIPPSKVNEADALLGCSVMKAPFKYLGVYKQKTLSIGGRLTLLKSVLGATPIYQMSLYKVPKAVLKTMEALIRDFFYGMYGDVSKIVWVKWSKVLASKKNGGLGISSFYALNRVLLLKWVWRYVSCDGSLWFRVINVIHGSDDQVIPDTWLGESCLRHKFPRLFALENDKDCKVAAKVNVSIVSSFRRDPKGGAESSQLNNLLSMLDSILLSNSVDRWSCDLNGEGTFCVKDFQNLLDEFFLPKSESSTRRIKSIPIKVNIFALRVSIDRLPTRHNLMVEPRLDFNLIPIGLGLKRFACLLALKEFWKESSIYHGGASGIIEIISYSRLKSLGKTLFLTILFFVLLIGVMLDIKVLFIGIVGCNIPI
nr:RNA-directed DNA polymerase, eukaryota, reverse transcriptase zinc-binding domain protein [Tanacetum cinerariifolium]